MSRPKPFPQLPTLQGDRFSLRRWHVSDAPALAAATRDAEIIRWTAMPEALDVAGAADWILGVQERIDEGELAYFAVADEVGLAVGGIGVGGFDWAASSGEAFYWIAAAARRRGLATAALRLVSRWAFEALGLARLELTTHPDNVASQRVAERAGYRREGLQRSKRVVRGRRWNLVAFSLLPGDPLEPAAAEPAPTWIYFIHPPREDFAATMTDEEKAVWAAHWERLERLYAEGAIVLVGPTLGRHNTGICVFEAPDEAAARTFMAEDPTIASGIATGELRPFRVSLLRGGGR